jgi:hypothetical protein
MLAPPVPPKGLDLNGWIDAWKDHRSFFISFRSRRKHIMRIRDEQLFAVHPHPTSLLPSLLFSLALLTVKGNYDLGYPSLLSMNKHLETTVWQVLDQQSDTWTTFWTLRCYVRVLITIRSFGQASHRVFVQVIERVYIPIFWKSLRGFFSLILLST